jgi:hypothetical protein
MQYTLVTTTKIFLEHESLYLTILAVCYQGPIWYQNRRLPNSISKSPAKNPILLSHFFSLVSCLGTSHPLVFKFHCILINVC